MSNHFNHLLASLGLCVLVGCGPTMATISGEVKVDGKPVANGVITFAALDGSASPASATIAEGRYEATMVAGNKRVLISAPVFVRKQREYDGPDAPMMDITAESLPDRYHANSELTFDAKPGANVKDWNLNRKK